MASSRLSQQSAPKYGRRLIPTVIDELAETQPDVPCYYVPKTNNEADGYDEITSSQFANAINRTAWWLEKILGKSQDFETIGYVGPSDVRYFVLMVACAKAGFTLLISSPRNSVEGHLSLINSSECSKWLVPSGTNVQHILEPAQIPSFLFPDLHDILDKTQVPVYPYKKTFEEGRYDPLALSHTSGSTGLPKPIIIKLGSAACIDALRLMDAVGGRMPTYVQWERTKIFSSMPLFHAAGIFFGLIMVFYYHNSFVFPVSGPVTASTVENAIKFAKPDAAFVAPSTVEDIVKTPSALEELRQLKFLTSGGGPVSHTAGNAVTARTNLHLVMGMTECQCIPNLPQDQDSWEYYQFHPQSGLEFRRQADGLYEAVFVRRKEWDLFQTIFVTFPEVEEWSTRDLYSAHPTKEGYWKYEGRGDDIIVLSNGEKFNPVTIEGRLAVHPMVKSALVVGHGRFQTAALLEPVSEIDNHDQFIEQAWPIIEQCNRESPAHARIQKQLIRVAHPEKPFLRAPKGTVMRRATINLYDNEINQLYEAAETLGSADKLDVSSEESICSGVGLLLREIIKVPDIPNDADLFSYGMDSLAVLMLQRTLQAALGHRVNVPQKLIYENTSISRLSRAIHRLLGSAEIGGLIEEEQRIQNMKDAISKYSWSLPKLPANGSAHVVVTGTTGSLGSYLLDSLMDSSRVAKVWCLNRSKEAETRQHKLAESRGLRSDWGTKVSFLHADLTAPHLGLEESDYSEITDRATHIIHNSWLVNFNLPLHSFEGQIQGVRNLIDTCFRSRHRVSFQFISSIGVAQNWNLSHEDLVPETTLTDYCVAGMGYGESKLVAEHIIERAAKGGILDAKITRVGQIAGPVKLGGKKGGWNKQEWLPTIIQTSAQLNMLPSTLGLMEEVDWIPVDLLSDIICELNLAAPEAPDDGVAFFHAVNPHKTSWSSLLPAIQMRLQETLESSVEVVSLEEWLDKLKDIAKIHNPNVLVSGVKLLDFYQSLVPPKQPLQSQSAAQPSGSQGLRDLHAVFDVTRTRRQSKLTGDLNPIGPEWMQVWLEQWGY